jgi:hypothetical protein
LEDGHDSRFIFGSIGATERPYRIGRSDVPAQSGKELGDIEPTHELSGARNCGVEG